MKLLKNYSSKRMSIHQFQTSCLLKYDQKANNHLLQKILEIQGKERIILKINKNVPCALCTASRPPNGPQCIIYYVCIALYNSIATYSTVKYISSQSLTTTYILHSSSKQGLVTQCMRNGGHEGRYWASLGYAGLGRPPSGAAIFSFQFFFC